MKHEQQKRKTRDVSSNKPEISANPGKMLKMSSFVAEARETEMEKLRETTSPNAPQTIASNLIRQDQDAPNPAKTTAEHAVLCTAGLAILSRFYSIRNRTEPIPSY